jgi:hypothetical protein
VRQWCERRGRAVGAILTLSQGWTLAQAWFTDPRQPGWQRLPLATLAALMRAQGLDGPFWDLPEGQA